MSGPPGSYELEGCPQPPPRSFSALKVPGGVRRYTSEQAAAGRASPKRLKVKASFRSAGRGRRRSGWATGWLLKLVKRAFAASKGSGSFRNHGFKDVGGRSGKTGFAGRPKGRLF